MKHLKLLLASIQAKCASLLSIARKRIEKIQSKVNEQNVEQQNDPTKDSEQPANDSTSSIRPIDTPIIHPETDPEKQWHQIQQRFWERQLTVAKMLNWVTIFVGAAGIGGLVVLYFTLQATQNAVDAAKAQAIAAQKAVEIAERTIKENIRIFRQDQRAWINIRSRTQPIAENKPLKAKLTILNTGKTPAKRVIQKIVIQKVSSHESPTFTYSVFYNNFSPIINPNTARKIDVTMLTKEKSNPLDPPILTKADVDEINSGNAYVVVFGKIAYFDIYDIPHWITFCFWKAWRTGTYPTRPCSEYNEIDKN